MSIDPPPSCSLWRQFVSEVKQKHALPAKQFLKESYEEHPLATTVFVIFAAISFTPVAVSAALAVFTIFVAISACFVILLGLALVLAVSAALAAFTMFVAISACFVILSGLALVLAVILLTSLFSSALITLLGTGALRLNPGGWFKAHRTSQLSAPSDTSDPTLTPPTTQLPWKMPVIPASTILSLLTRVGWKIGLLVVVLLSEGISNIRLPWHVRNHFIYRSLFGAGLFGPRHSAHFLGRVLSLPARIVRKLPWIVILIVTAPFQLLGWKFALALYLILANASRSRAFVRGKTIRVVAVAGLAVTAAVDVLRSQRVTEFRDLLWKWVHQALSAPIVFLRTELERLEASTQKPMQSEAEDTPPQQSQPEEATYEMVSPIVTGTTTLGFVSVPVEMSSLRQRKTARGGSEDE
ncbi:hypothetical protein K438DRAFT_1992287 [Mycena galopus ATCC 62051]|nr:hypothetical protein K438DRAFT_1992287 [Mycena galopus ATCC 62051]